MTSGQKHVLHSQTRLECHHDSTVNQQIDAKKIMFRDVMTGVGCCRWGAILGMAYIVLAGPTETGNKMNETR